jgi:serine/threonine-protein kinase
VAQPSPDSERDPLLGQRIGRYAILKRLARGGMAEIFLAEAADLPSVRRIVVIKRMLPALSRDSAYAKMFLEEARILAALAHPNIVQVVEVGQDGADLFIAMEHVDGESLEAVVAACAAARETLPLGHAALIMSGVLAGLGYLHDKRDDAGQPLNLIHRDISPRNVLVTYEGAVKLIDFGIARPSNRLGATRGDRVRGTVPYMSPEQCRGHHLDRRSDLFSAGILLYELTVGRRLFDGEGEFDVFKQIVEGELPQPSVARAGFPSVLEPVVLRALAKAPAARFQTAAELLDALDGVMAALGLTPSARALRGFMHERFASQISAWQRVQKAEGADRAQALTAVTATAEASVDGDAAPVVTPPRQRRRARVLVAGVLGAAVVGAAAAGWRALLPQPRHAAPALPTPLPSTPTPTPPNSTPPPAPAPAVSAAPPATKPATAAPRRHADPERSPNSADRSGELVVDAHPWCRVTIDGEPRGPTPVLVKLPAGSHRVELVNDEYGIARTTFLTVEAGRTLRRRFDFPVTTPTEPNAPKR